MIQNQRSLTSFFAAALIGLTYWAPQGIHYWRGGSEAVFMTSDELFYAGRFARALGGKLTVGNAWTFEHAEKPSVLPFLPEATIGILGRVLNLTVEQVVILSRVILPALGFLAFIKFLMVLEFSYSLSFFTAFWFFCEPGLFSYKPLAGLLLRADFLPINRFLNPMFALPLFFLACLCGARAFLAQRRAHSWAVAAGVLLGLHFYISIYYWTHLALAFLLCPVLLKTPNRWRIAVIGAFTAAVVAAPSLIASYRMQSDADFHSVLWRCGIFIKDRGWYLIGHKALWAFVAVSTGLAIVNGDGARIIAAFIMAGLICLFSTLLTGVSLQNYHWHYTLAPCLFAGVALVGRGWIARRNHGNIPGGVRIAAWCFLSACLASAVAANMRGLDKSLNGPPDTTAFNDESYREAWHWLKRQAAPGSVVLASDAVMLSIPARTGLNIWATRVLGGDLVGFEEILNRYQFLWAVEGQTVESLEEKLVPKAPSPLPMWDFGLTQVQLRELEEQGRPPFSHELMIMLAQGLAREQGRLSQDHIVRLARGYRLDYLLRGPYESTWGNFADNRLALERVGTFGSVRIDRVLGWRGKEL